MTAPKSEVRVYTRTEMTMSASRLLPSLVVSKSDHDQEVQALKEEIEELKAKLQAARDMFNLNALDFDVNEYDKKLSSITIDSIKRGE